METGTIWMLAILAGVMLFVVFWGTSSHNQEANDQKKLDQLADLTGKSKRYGDFIQNLHKAYLQSDLRFLLLIEQEKIYRQMAVLLPNDTEIVRMIEANQTLQNALRDGTYQNGAERANVPQAAMHIQAKLKALGDFLEQLHERRELTAEIFKGYYQSLHLGFMQAEVDTEIAVGRHAVEQHNLYAANHHFNRALGMLQPNNVNGHFQEQIDEVRGMIAQLQQTDDNTVGETMGSVMQDSADKKWGEYLDDSGNLLKKQ